MPNIIKKKNQVKEEKSSGKPRRAKIIPSENPQSVVHLRSLTISSQYLPYGKSVPFIRLLGVWLEEAGFRMDSKVDVIVDTNLLIIKPAGT